MSYQAGSAEPDERAQLFVEPREREARPRFRGVVAIALALLLMGFFAGALWFAYQEGLRHANGGGTGAGNADVPLIRADERPTKVKPDKPGGMEIPDRDKLIYTQKRAAVEHLLPAPEKPMARPMEPPAAAPPEASSPPATSATPASMPEAAKSPPAPVTLTEPSQTAPKNPGKTVAEPPGAVKSASLQSAATANGASRIQLGALRSEDVARREWDRIRRANTDLLGSVSATLVRADLGDKGVFYRIQTGPIADAGRICSELKRRNVGCIIAR